MWREQRNGFEDASTHVNVKNHTTRVLYCTVLTTFEPMCVWGGAEGLGFRRARFAI